MAPKKKGGKKKKAGKKAGNADGGGGEDGLGIALPEETIRHLRSQAEALEMRLADRTETRDAADADRRAMKERMLRTEQLYQDERRATLDITRDMTRQYKGMQEDLLNKINDRERTIQRLVERIDLGEKAHARELQERDAVLSEREGRIERLEAKLEDATAGFASMLSDALDEMKERIEVRSSAAGGGRGDGGGEPPAAAVVPIRRRMEEFRLRP